MRDAERDILDGPVVDAQHFNFRISDYLGWQRDGSLILRPHFQRGSVWQKTDKSFLIDSILRGYPIPMVILQEEVDLQGRKVNRRVVDGQQRLRTAIAYADSAALGDLGDSDFFSYSPPAPTNQQVELVFAQLSPELQQRFLNTQIGAVILGSGTSEGVALEVYDRLNSTGLPLAAQELRYARRSGPFSELSYRLARDNQRRWSTWQLFREMDIARMREVEFTSELVLLLMDGIERTGRREIDAAYQSRVVEEQQAEWVARHFQDIMDALDRAYGSPSRPDPIRPFRTRGWFYAVFAVLMFESGILDGDGRKPLFADIDVPGTNLLGFDAFRFLSEAADRYTSVRRSDTELARAVSGAASDKGARRRRFEFLKDMLVRR